MKKMTNRTDMNVNVILTFNKPDPILGETQEFFDLLIPLDQQDKNYDAFTFIEKKLFPRIIKSCTKYNRNHKDLIKISTCSEWDLYEIYTGNKSLRDFNHPCKWYFGFNRSDLDYWEKKIMKIFEFGINADMGDIEKKIKQMIEQHEKNLLKVSIQ